LLVFGSSDVGRDVDEDEPCELVRVGREVFVFLGRGRSPPLSSAVLRGRVEEAEVLCGREESRVLRVVAGALACRRVVVRSLEAAFAPLPAELSPRAESSSTAVSPPAEPLPPAELPPPPATARLAPLLVEAAPWADRELVFALLRALVVGRFVVVLVGDVAAGSATSASVACPSGAASRLVSSAPPGQRPPAPRQWPRR
jgi:hypothetical protein